MFRFKEFTVDDSKTAMKIGTDGVLLGAWVDTSHNPSSILDIGTGTGVIALQLAQQSVAEQIEALEIEEQAFEQAVDNFENSPWADRLYCYHASFLEFVEEFEDEEPYDLIVCNPPFYAEDFKTESKSRDIARFQDALPFEHLLFGVAKLLSGNGEFSVIIPYSEEEKFIALAETFQLYPKRITHVKGNPEALIKRSLLSFGFKNSEIIKSELIIETQRHVYTQTYINLVKDFYLKM